MKVVLKIIGFIFVIAFGIVMLVAQLATHAVYAVGDFISEETVSEIVSETLENMDMGELLMGGETPLIPPEALASFEQAGISQEQLSGVLNSPELKGAVGSIAGSIAAAVVSGDKSDVISKDDFTKLVEDNIATALGALGMEIPAEQLSAITGQISGMYDEIIGMIFELVEGGFTSGDPNEGDGMSQKTSHGFVLLGYGGGRVYMGLGALALSVDANPEKTPTGGFEFSDIPKYINGSKPIPTDPFEILRIVTSQNFKYLLIAVSGVLFLLMVLCRWSVFKGLRCAAVVTLLAGLPILGIGIGLKSNILTRFISVEELLGQFASFITPIMGSVAKVFLKNGGIACGAAIIVIILMTIIIKAIKKKKKNKPAEGEELVTITMEPAPIADTKGDEQQPTPEQ